MPTCQKPEPRKRTKARKDRLEDAVQAKARAHCLEREHDSCAVVSRLPNNQMLEVFKLFGVCSGVLTLAHLAGHRRSHTRGLPPEVRHDPKHLLMLCSGAHHPAEESARLRFIGLTKAGMEGPITWHVEPAKTVRVH